MTFSNYVETSKLIRATLKGPGQRVTPASEPCSAGCQVGAAKPSHRQSHNGGNGTSAGNFHGAVRRWNLERCKPKHLGNYFLSRRITQLLVFVTDTGVFGLRLDMRSLSFSPTQPMWLKMQPSFFSLFRARQVSDDI